MARYGESSITPSPSSDYEEEDMGFEMHQRSKLRLGNKFNTNSHPLTSSSSSTTTTTNVSHQRVVVHHTPPPSAAGLQSQHQKLGLKSSNPLTAKEQAAMLTGGRINGGSRHHYQQQQQQQQQHSQHQQHLYHQQQQQQQQFQSVSASSAESLPSASGSSTKALVHSPNRFTQTEKEMRKYQEAMAATSSAAGAATTITSSTMSNGKTLKECILDSLESDAANFKAVEIINQQRPFR